MGVITLKPRNQVTKTNSPRGRKKKFPPHHPRLSVLVRPQTPEGDRAQACSLDAASLGYGFPLPSAGAQGGRGLLKR